MQGSAFVSACPSTPLATHFSELVSNLRLKLFVRVKPLVNDIYHDLSNRNRHVPVIPLTENRPLNPPPLPPGKGAKVVHHGGGLTTSTRHRSPQAWMRSCRDTGPLTREASSQVHCGMATVPCYRTHVRRGGAWNSFRPERWRTGAMGVSCVPHHSHLNRSRKSYQGNPVPEIRSIAAL